jgi:anti-sigma factor RsiW
MNAMGEKADDREEIETLLPWHAAGTLSRRDAERVERALATDQELARRFSLVREELAETIRLNESLGAPSARAMEKLFAEIDAESATARKPRFSLHPRTKIAEFFAAFTPRTVAFAGGAAALVILLQAGVIGSMLLKNNQSYATASAPPSRSTTRGWRMDPYERRSGVTSKVESVDLLVTFVPQATTDQVTKFLHDHNATIVDGPKGPGMYRLRFEADGSPKAETDRVMKEMRQSRSVVSSEFPAD